MGALEIGLAVGSILVGLLWEYYLHRKSMRSEPDISTEFNTDEGDVISINDGIKIIVENGNRTDKHAIVLKGSVELPDGTVQELENVKVDFKTLKIKDLLNPRKTILDLKKVKTDTSEDDNNSEIDAEDIVEDIVDVVEEATSSDPVPEKAVKTTFSVLKLIGHGALWLIGKSKAHKAEEEDQVSLMAINGQSETPADPKLENTKKLDVEAWIDAMTKGENGDISTTSPTTEAITAKIEEVGLVGQATTDAVVVPAAA